MIIPQGKLHENVRRDDFSSEAPGRLLSVGDGCRAFVPAALPPKLDYGPPLVVAL